MAICASIGDVPGVDDVVDHTEILAKDKIAVIHFKSGKKVPVHLWEKPTKEEVHAFPVDKKQAYILLMYTDVGQMSEAINKYISEGYKPLGAPFIESKQYFTHIYQAMVIT